MEEELSTLNGALLKCKTVLAELENRLAEQNQKLSQQSESSLSSRESALREISRLLQKIERELYLYNQYILKYIFFRAILRTRDAGASQVVLEDLWSMYQCKLPSVLVQNHILGMGK
jgi:hypothetical protein